MSENEVRFTALENCSREPIHIPGKIQAHGFLIVVSPENKIIRVSDNLREHIALSPHEILNQKIEVLFDDLNDAQVLIRQLQDETFANPLVLSLKSGQQFDAIGHRLGENRIIEFEKSVQEQTFSHIYQIANTGLKSIEDAESLFEACRRAALKVKELVRYERVMIYRFDPEWNGEVIAEVTDPGVESFMGLRYPASDIPEQARKLYLQNWLRIIPDVNYQPSVILPESTSPLDLTSSVLRSVSPVHVQYLKNMGVGASMSISIIKDKKLWGLIACHHRSSNYVPYENRQAAEFVARFLSLQLAAKAKLEDRDYRLELFAKEKELASTLSKGKELTDGLFSKASLFLQLTDASGVAVYLRGKVYTIGLTPTTPQILKIVNFLKLQMRNQEIYSTHELGIVCPEVKSEKDNASGLLAISIPEPEPSFVMWFRPEEIQTVSWAGNPNKPVETRGNEQILSPRHSFKVWQEQVAMQSKPWKISELEAAKALRRSLIEEDLARQVSLERATRRELEKSNQQLDEFANLVSHDLKEPLRGMNSFATFLLEDLGGKLDDESLEYLTDIKQLSGNAQALVRDLFEYSRVGRVDLAFRQVSLQGILEEVKTRMSPLLKKENAEILQSRSLPDIYCDAIRVGEVFANLIANAVKYNHREKKVIEIGYDDTNPFTFFVKDNGIGIAKKDQERIFQVFQRLESSDKFSEGTGAGLSIAKAIIEKHGGKIGIESVEEVGTKFYFTLSPEKGVE